MAELSDRFDHVFIHRESVESPVAQRIFMSLPAEKITVVDSEPLSEKKASSRPATSTRAKGFFIFASLRVNFLSAVLVHDQALRAAITLFSTWASSAI